MVGITTGSTLGIAGIVSVVVVVIVFVEGRKDSD